MSDERITWSKLIVRFSVLFLLLGACVFFTAGDVNWWGAWAYLAAIVVVTFWGRSVVMRKNPAMLAERSQSLRKENVQHWDRVLMPLVAMVLPVMMLLTAALDHRLGWTTGYHVAWEIGALVPMVFGLLFANRAFIANGFFSGTVRIQSEEGHTVVASGPYRWVRHPGYAGVILANMATPIILGSLWALIPATLLSMLTVVRTVLEDRTLRAELDGYAEYARVVRYRLVPGVW